LESQWASWTATEVLAMFLVEDTRMCTPEPPPSEGLDVTLLELEVMLDKETDAPVTRFEPST
jgi:hypothetical protein